MRTTINLCDFTNFLNSGAILRWKDSWYLFWELSEKTALDTLSTIDYSNISSESVSLGSASSEVDGIYSGDYVSRNFFHQNFGKFAILSKSEFLKLINEGFKEASQANQSSVSGSTGVKETTLSSDFFTLKNSKTLKTVWSEIDKTPFSESFCLIKKAIKEGKIKKAVPFNFQYGQLASNEAINSLHKLTLLSQFIDAGSSLIPYGQWDETQGFMGITPELFFKIEGQELQTMALAGTTDKKVPKETFLNDPKEIKEHQLVIDDIKEKLKEFGEVHAGSSYVFELPHLNHLRTDVNVKLFDGENFINILKKMHPTSALGIFPNNEYWNDFVQLPLQNLREGFGAPWGFKLQGLKLFVVGIRRLEWKENFLRIPAGCGVVELSDIDKECAEVERKINSVKKAFFPEESERNTLSQESQESQEKELHINDV